MNTLRAALLPSLLCLALTGCDGPQFDAEAMQTETREVAAFDSIEVEGAARVEITVGAAESLSIDAPATLARRITSEVRGETLHIKSKPRNWLIASGSPRITLRISLPKLASLRLEGGNDARITGYDGGGSKIRVDGAAHIKAQGRLADLTVHLAGAGHADLADLVTETAEVTVDGVGSVYVHATQSLDATMNGVGAILYSGAPRKVSTQMNGVGTIGQRKPQDRVRDDNRSDDAPRNEAQESPDTTEVM